MGESTQGKNFDFTPNNDTAGGVDPITSSAQQGALPGGGIDRATGRKKERSIFNQIADPGGLVLKGGTSGFDPSQFTSGIFGQDPAFVESKANFQVDPLSPDVNRQLQGIQTDPRVLNQLRQESLRRGPSRFTQLRSAQLPGEAQALAGRLRAGSQGTAAQARGQLAARGGLTGGARERIAQEAQRSAFGGLRQAQAQQGQQLSQLALSDEQARQAQLGGQFGREITALAPQFQGLEAAAKARQFDTGQRKFAADLAQREAERRSLFDIERFKARQQQAGALAQAQATADSGKK